MYQTSSAPCDSPAVAGAAHELLVDVVPREVAGDASEQIDVGFADRFVDFDLLPDGERGERFLGGCHGSLLARRHDSSARRHQRVSPRTAD